VAYGEYERKRKREEMLEDVEALQHTKVAV